MLVPYKILLSYPDNRTSNKLEILEKIGKNERLVYRTRSFEDLNAAYVKNQTKYAEYLKSLYLAFSSSGTTEGKLIYVNYAREEDFEHLIIERKLNITGRICLARYGKMFRGLKAEIAAKHGCSALILYSDPADYNPEADDLVYPLSSGLPETGVQRGSLKTPYNGLGDYLTPMYPATAEAYRLKLSKSNLPNLIVHVIRSDDAKVLFSMMSEDKKKIKKEWIGRLNVNYKIGGDFQEDHLLARLTISVNNVLKTSYNVFAIIEGSVEKDRYIILGNHYDSWGPGSIDPTIGISSLMELARSFQVVINNTRWKPKRSILFCAWGAEEYGSIGSREFVEEFSKILSSRTIAYLNSDVAVLGNYSAKFKSHPLLRKVIRDAIKAVPNPDENEQKQGQFSVYDTYARKFRNNPENSTEPIIKTMTTGSDYVHFIGFTAIPSLDIRYTYDETSMIDFYSLYHSAYENVHNFESFIDPNYNISLAVTKIWSQIALLLSETTLIPYSVDEYVDEINECLLKIIKKLNNPISGISFNNINLLKTKSDLLLKTGLQFNKYLKENNLRSVQKFREINDKMILLDKAFLYDHHLEGREGVRHALFSPSLNGKQICFAVIDDMIHEYSNNIKSFHYKHTNFKTKIDEEISRIIFFIDRAISILNITNKFL